jgi:hypothetical protein
MACHAAISSENKTTMGKLLYLKSMPSIMSSESTILSMDGLFKRHGYHLTHCAMRAGHTGDNAKYIVLIETNLKSSQLC